MPQTLKRQLKDTGKAALRRLFETSQKFGFDILPRHYYSEIPDIRVLRSSNDWKAPRSLTGILGEIDEQVTWVDECTRRFRATLTGFRIHKAAVKMNGSDEGYGEVEADFLYSYVRTIRPAQIIQVGCGVSTAVCLLAAQDEGYTPRIICIEPHPTGFLQKESQAGRIELIARKLQDVGRDFANQLADGDLFFIDSSHTLAPAGEVNLIILELLPRLQPGVYVHFHDVYFPYDYSPNTLSSTLFFWHETALLYAFLTMNPHFEILASLSLLFHRRIEDLAQFFPTMQPKVFAEGLSSGDGQFPSSVFLRRRIFKSAQERD